MMSRDIQALAIGLWTIWGAAGWRRAASPGLRRCGCGTRDHEVLGHVEVGPLVGLAVDGQDIADGELLVGLDRERELGHVHGQLERRRQRAEDEELAGRERLPPPL